MLKRALPAPRDAAPLRSGSTPEREREASTGRPRWRAPGPEATALVALTVAAAAIRLATLGAQSYWADEALTVYEVKLSLGRMLGVVHQVETTPPLYFVLAWAWARVLGTSEAALRLLSALAGIAMVPVAYAVAATLATRRAALLTAALVAVNPFLVWYSQEARSYSLFALFSALATLCFARLLRGGDRRWLAGWTVACALALATHFFAVFLVVPLALWLVWTKRDRATLLAAGSLAAIELALLPLALGARPHGTGWIAAIPLPTRLVQLPNQFLLSSLTRRVSPGTGLLIAAAIVLLATVLLARASAAERRPAGVWLAVAAGTLGLPLILSRLGFDYFYARNVLFVLVPLAVVLAVALTTERAGMLGRVAAVALVGGSLAVTLVVSATPALQKPDWRGVARALGEASGARFVIAAGGASTQPLKVYLPNVPWNAPRGAIAVREIDVVGTRTWLPRAQGFRGVRPRSSLGPAIPADRLPFPGFRLIARRTVAKFVIARYLAARPSRLTRRDIARHADGLFRVPPRNTLIMVQTPPGAPR